MSATRPCTSAPRGQLGQDAAQPQGVLAQRRPNQVVAGGGRVPLVEDQVDDLEHRRQPRAELGPARHLEGHARLGQRSLGPDDALGHRRLRHEERAGDLLGGEPAEQAQRERQRAWWRAPVAGREDQAQEVVADRVVDRGVEVRLGPGARPPAGARAPRACARRRRGGAGGRSRRLAVAMSQAPGLSGTPVSGHRSSMRRRARPGRGPRPARRRGPSARGRRSAAATRSARPRRSRAARRATYARPGSAPAARRASRTRSCTSRASPL